MMEDLHTHTYLSDGKNSTALNVRGAQALKLDCIAITDHWRPDTYDFTISKLKQEVHKAAEISQVKVLAGAEVLCQDLAGNLTLCADEAEELDLILVEIARDMDDLTNRVGAVDRIIDCYEQICYRHSFVDILAHPFNVLGPIRVELAAVTDNHLERLARAMLENDVCFEVMSDQWWWFQHEDLWTFTSAYTRIVRAMGELGVSFTLGSDAHSHQGVGNLSWALGVLQRAGVARGSIKRFSHRGS
jgi:histidinol phosphatase-like PHP family hydrolase